MRARNIFKNIYPIFFLILGELLRFPREKILVPENPFDLEYYISKVKKGLKLDDVKSAATGIFQNSILQISFPKIQS